MFMTAKEFCKTTGFPARTLARYLHEGRIDCHRAGRRYVLDKDSTLEQLRALSHNENTVSFIYHRPKKRRRQKKNQNDIFDGAETFKARISCLKKDLKSE